MNPQAKVLEMLKNRGSVTSPEFVRECQGWDHRKCISRLRRQGHQIISRKVDGKNYHEYLLYEGQMRFF
jgi:hypothetical protein